MLQQYAFSAKEVMDAKQPPQCKPNNSSNKFQIRSNNLYKIINQYKETHSKMTCCVSSCLCLEECPQAF